MSITELYAGKSYHEHKNIPDNEKERTKINRKRGRWDSLLVSVSRNSDKQIDVGSVPVIQIFVYSFKELSNVQFFSFKRKRDKQIGLGGPSDTRPKSYPHTLMTYSKHLPCLKCKHTQKNIYIRDTYIPSKQVRADEKNMLQKEN